MFLISFPLLETQLINPISIKNPISSTGTNSPIKINGNYEMDSYFMGNTSTGLWEGSPHILENLGIDSFELGYGIKISNTNRHLIIQDSSIMSGQFPATGTGIEIINSSNIKIIGNALSENYYGLEIKNSKFISISYNEILENQMNGMILINSFNITLADNVISDNGGNGIYLQHSFNISFEELRANTINSNGLHGIYLSESHQNNIQYSYISQNEGDGIRLSQSNSNHITLNFISSSGGTCIKIINSLNNIVENNLDCEPAIENNYALYYLYAGIGVIGLMFVISVIRRRKKRSH